MKLGLVSAILSDMNYEEMIDTVSSLGLECVEVAAWPKEKTNRRYAGVQHIDPELAIKDKYYRAYILDYAKTHNVELASLCYNPNMLTPDLKKRNEYISYLKKVIEAASLLHIKYVLTFIGRDQHKTFEENIVLAKKVWPPILKFCEKMKVKLIIENCPMIFTKEQWPGGWNIMNSPEHFDIIFRILKSKSLGLCFDPSHFIWQMMDYISPVKKYKNKIWQVHFKDIKLHKNELATKGIMSYPLDIMSPVIPGHGDIDWKMFIKELKKQKYDSYACIEIEDKNYEKSRRDVIKAIKETKKYIEKFL